LNTPVFLNIIGTRYGFIKSELEENLDEIKELMDAPMGPTSSTATSSTATSSTGPASSTATAPTAPTAPAPVSTRRRLSNRLRDLIKKSKP
jgi:hypothetical protein